MGISDDFIGVFCMSFASLDPDVLLQGMLDRLAVLSDGEMADLPSHSPIRVMFEAIAFSLVEYGNELNGLPEAIIVRMLELSGMNLTGGSKAGAKVTLEFVSPLVSSLTIPSGTLFSASSLRFRSVGTVTANPGSSILDVDVEAEGVGTDYNVPRRNIITMLSNVGNGLIASVYNADPASGGSNPESLSESLSLSTAFMSDYEALITASDFKAAVGSNLGVNTLTIPIAGLSEDRLSIESDTGVVHLNVLKPDFTDITQSEKDDLIAGLEPRLLIGTRVYVSGVSLVVLDIKGVVKLVQGANPGDVFADTRERMLAYLNPLNWDPGESVNYKELEYVCRDDSRVKLVNGVSLKEQGSDGDYVVTNLPMPNEWTLPVMGHFALSMVDSAGRVYDYGYGFFDDEPETPVDGITELT